MIPGIFSFGLGIKNGLHNVSKIILKQNKINIVLIKHGKNKKKIMFLGYMCKYFKIIHS